MSSHSRPALPARIPAPPRPQLTLSGRLGDLRQLLAAYGDIPLRVLVRDMAADTARPDAPDVWGAR
jgi:hypothetical protein